VLEVPSGAWADTVSRRGLLVLGSLLTAAGFATWTVVPSYPGFAAGFVLWGVGGSLQSGTFQALLYDELAAQGSAADYPRVLGLATSAAEGGALLGILAAAPLYAWGGYGLVGWASVLVVLLQAGLATSLPPAPKVVPAGTADRAGPAAPAYRSYLAMLRSGTTEALRQPTVRRGVLLASVLYGFTALDEYFGLLADENGSATGTVPLLVGLTVAGSLAGSLLAGRTAGMRSATMAWALVAAGAALAVGSLVGDAGRLGLVGFTLIGLAYGVIANTTIVAEARLQDAIDGPARATVTSVSGLFSELVALLIFGAVALLSTWWPMAYVVAVLAVPVVAVAAVVPRWLPRRRLGGSA
jgi:MFS family permease